MNPGTKPASAPRPRLAILGSRGIPARYGGFETFAEQISARLAEAGFDVTVFCERGDGPAPAAYRGVRLEYVAAPALGPLSAPVFDVLSLWRARRSFDVVYMLGYGAGLFCWIPRMSGSAVWINMDGLEWKRAKWGPLGRAFLWAMSRAAARTASRLIFDNAAVRDEVVGGRRLCNSVIEYGAPLDVDPPGPAALEPFGLEPGAYFLVVCRVEPENHVLEIVRAFEAAATTKQLVVVGNVARGSPYVRRVRRAAGARVRFPGTVYDAAALRALRTHCQAYVHGHSVGGTNPSLLEALACGNVAIAHDNPYNREVLGEHALYFRSEVELALRLAECERLTSAERAALRERGRTRVAAHYSWERIADCYAELLLAGAARDAQSASARPSRPVEPSADTSVTG